MKFHCLLLSILLNLYSAITFICLGATSGPIPTLGIANISWVAGVFLFLIAFHAPQKVADNGFERSKAPFAILLPLFVLAVILRIRGNDDIGPFLDEYFWIEDVRKFFSGEQYTIFGFIGDQPSNFHSALILLLRCITGNDLFSVRTTSACYSIISLYFLFAVATKIIGSYAALVAAILLTVSAWDINNSHFGWLIVNSVAPLSMILIYCLIVISKSCNTLYWAITGVFLGFCVNTGYSQILMSMPVLL